MRHICWRVVLVLLFITTLARAEERMVYVNVPSVNIRAEAGTRYKVIKSVSTGYPLKVLAEQQKWYQVELKDKKVGWVFKSMVTDAVPLAFQIKQLETKLATQANEFEQTRKQLQAQINFNAKLNKELEDKQQELDKLTRQHQQLQQRDRIKIAVMVVGIILLGWAAGFATGFFKRQAEDKRFFKMMIEANSLKKEL
jgi:uncharacterized protein YgiM (DUF1202 family)